MKTIALLENRIQNYEWGSLTAISELLGREPSGLPEAELWLGAHRKSPSSVSWRQSEIALDKQITRDPETILGREILSRFGASLPFLFKVLASAKPLSIQVHPSREQARAGFARENAAGLPLDAPDRNYRDDNHKPEVIVAVTPFWALKGFRPVAEIAATFGEIDSGTIADTLWLLHAGTGSEGLRKFFTEIMTMDRARQHALADDIVSAARAGRGSADHHQWIIRLNELYPGDVGLACALLLNLVLLKPGEGLFLPAGELHAYLEGTGVELMANSDNVLRGGLTPKHIDVPELLATLTFEPGRPELLTPQARGPAESVYATPAEEFELSTVDLDGSESWISPRKRGVEILLGVEGDGAILDCGTDETLTIGKGTAILVPAAVSRYRISGTVRLYRTVVP